MHTFFLAGQRETWASSFARGRGTGIRGQAMKRLRWVVPWIAAAPNRDT